MVCVLVPLIHLFPESKTAFSGGVGISNSSSVGFLVLDLPLLCLGFQVAAQSTDAHLSSVIRSSLTGALTCTLLSFLEETLCDPASLKNTVPLGNILLKTFKNLYLCMGLYYNFPFSCLFLTFCVKILLAP